MGTATQAPRGRDETPAERADRNWNEILQEVRVIQTGTQIVGGFLLTLPFQQRFGVLDAGQRGIYLGLLVVAALASAAGMAPVSVHRTLFRRRRKWETVAIGHRCVRIMLTLVGLLTAGSVYFIVDVLVGTGAAAGVGGAMFAVFVVALAVIPAWVRYREDRAAER